MNTKELWKHIPIKPFNKSFQASTKGRIKSVTRYVKQRDRGKLIKTLRKGRIIKSKGNAIELHYNKCNKKFTISYIIAQTFLPNFNKCRKVEHKNHNILDNRVENLQWVDPKNKYINEKWKNIPVKPYNKWYMVSNYGRILRKARNEKRIDNGKPTVFHLKEQCLKLHHDKDGYLRVTLYNKDSNKIKGKMFFVHRLVAKAFIPNPKHLSQVNHILPDENDNNKVSNLEWCTAYQNDHYANHIERVKKTRIKKYGTPVLLIKKQQKWYFPDLLDSAKFIYTYYHKKHSLHTIRTGIQYVLRSPHHHTAYGFKPIKTTKHF